MSTSKEYKAIKNFIHNELGMSREVISSIIKDETKILVKRVLCNMYGKGDIESVIEEVLRREVLNKDYHYSGTAKSAMSDKLRSMATKLIENEFDIALIKKTDEMR